MRGVVQLASKTSISRQHRFSTVCIVTKFAGCLNFLQRCKIFEKQLSGSNGEALFYMHHFCFFYPYVLAKHGIGALGVAALSIRFF